MWFIDVNPGENGFLIIFEKRSENSLISLNLTYISDLPEDIPLFSELKNFDPIRKYILFSKH